MSHQEETEIPEEEKEELLEEVPYQYKITSYGADYPVDSLVKRIQEGDIIIPSFQRGYVWNATEASRFIESLLLGLPVPGIFFSKEQDSKKLLVIDGQQRLRTLQYFYEGIFEPTGKKFAITLSDSKFSGQTYKSLSEDDRRILDDSIIHATIVKQDEPSEDQSSIYKIFERLNTSGVALSPQEIRASIYQGEFNDLLKQLNAYPSWRSLFGPINKRMRDQEMILRFFALHFAGELYDRPMKEFLNKFMGMNRHLKFYKEPQLKMVFETPVQTIHTHIGTEAFRRSGAFNAAVFDSIMIGVARRLEHGPITDSAGMRERHSDLLKDETFEELTTKSTADKEVVKARLGLATEAFADVR